jgi:hypothetical protein
VLAGVCGNGRRPDDSQAHSTSDLIVTVQLFIAAAGKTAHVLNLVRHTSPRASPPGAIPASGARLARGEGAIGVRVLTFGRLYAKCLNAAGELYTELSDPVQ